MVKKFRYIVIIFILIVMTTLSVKADIYDITSWKDLTTADIDEAARVANEDGNAQQMNYIYSNILGASDITAAQFDSYESAQHYVEVASYFLNLIENDDSLRSSMTNPSGGSVNSDNEEWIKIENNIQIASQVKENPSSGNNGGGNNGGSNNGSSSDEKAWNDYTLEDYRGNGEKGLPEMWEIIKNVPIANLTAEEKVYYVQCLDAIDENKGSVDYNFSAEVSSEIQNLYDQVWDSYEDELKGTEAETIIKDGPIYYNPLFNQGLEYGEAETVTPDTIIGDADSFMDTGSTSDVATINQDNADVVFDSIYNILLAIGIAVTVIWGLVIAIKLMMSSVEEKAEYKKLLAPYLVGCVVIFGSFIIWKIVIVIMNNVL